MARIRTVKPSLFRHESLFEAERDSGLPLRLAFIGLFTCCDREGRFSWRPRTLKLDVMPHDDIDFSRVLDALWTRGLVQKYASNGEEFGFIPTFLKHQVINNREAVSELPNPCNCEIIDASSTRDARDTVTTQGNMEGKGREGEGKGIAALRTAAVAAEVVSLPKDESSEPAGEPPDWWPKQDRYGRIVGEVDKALVNKIGSIVIRGKPWGVLAELRRVYHGDERAVLEMLLKAHGAVDARDYCMGVVSKADNGFKIYASHEKYPEDAYRGAL